MKVKVILGAVASLLVVGCHGEEAAPEVVQEEDVVEATEKPSPSDDPELLFDYERSDDFDPRDISSSHAEDFNLRIVGGDTATRDYPWQASLQYKTWSGSFKSFCGGSLIHPQYILTAGHCVGGGVDRVVLGQYDIYGPTESTARVRKVKKIYRHQNYNANTLENDIALLRLDKAITDIQPVEVARDNSFGDVGDEVEVIGWGTTKFGGSPSQKLQHVSVPVVSYQQCTKRGSYRPNDIFEGQQICAGFKKGGKDSCQGDSGGPLFQTVKQSNNEGRQVQVGVVSWGEGCAKKNKYGIYTKVAFYNSWIQSRTGNLVRFYDKPRTLSTKALKYAD